MRLILSLVLLMAATASAEVKPVRVPDGGLQPQAAVDAKGVIHLVYFKGEAKGGDLFYVTSADAGKTFSKPVRVNSEPRSAIATGSIRGAQMALGREGRVHVAWNGSHESKPKAPGGETPMLYSRSDGKGGFEPQRNLITQRVGLDGGGSVAADDAGKVYVVWQAPENPDGNEQDRQVWVAASEDDGQTFAKETKFSLVNGVCACCGMKAIVAEKGLAVFYRAATKPDQRDMMVIESHDDGRSSGAQSYFKTGKCPMSSCSMAKIEQQRTAFAYEESKGVGVHWVLGLPNQPGYVAPRFKVPGAKHPSLAVSARNEVLMVCALGTGWNKGGTISWYVWNQNGQPLDEGEAKDLPAWSFPAGVALPDGNFVVLY